MRKREPPKHRRDRKPQLRKWRREIRRARRELEKSGAFWRAQVQDRPTTPPTLSTPQPAPEGTLVAVAEVVTTRIPYDGGTAATAAVVALCQLYLRDLPSDERQEVLELAKQVEVERTSTQRRGREA